VYEQMEPGKQPAVLISEQSNFRLAETIVRGLTYRLHGTFIDDSYRIEPVLIEDHKAEEVVRLLDKFGVTYERGPGFSVRRATPSEDVIAALYLIQA
jgi:hypothetical protein